MRKFWKMSKKLCPNCGGDIEIRNPTGKCDHLYYPENTPNFKKDQKKELVKQANLIITAILYDLTDRKGIGNEWEAIDDEIQRDIKKEWRKKIVEILEEK